jgi:hypothetical protein
MSAGPYLRKPQKFVAVLSHNYTPEALKQGLHALKARPDIITVVPFSSIT